MKKSLLIAAAATTGLAGCTTYFPHSVSMGGVVLTNVEIVGRVEGMSRAHYIMGYGPVGDDSLKAAVADALSQRGGDTIVNVTVDRSVTKFPPMVGGIYESIQTTVSGTAVRFVGSGKK
ncbi:MAG: hypothetical protein HY547_00060 [Elusimicrobia bacterium]|nr:hypothetical protein [Elusimicrobiota bacterium]